MAAAAAARPGPPAPPPPRAGRLAALFGAGTALLVVLAALHVTQGTSGAGAADVLRALAGADPGTLDVLVAARLPRLLAALVVGAALGLAGAAFQSVARNTLASPDTLAVNAGAHLAVVAVAAFGVALPVLAAGGVAFAGGLLAAAFVLLLSAGGAGGPTRLILAGSAVALALGSLTMLLLLLFEQGTVGRFAWGSGTLVQSDLRAVTQLGPIVLAAGLALAALGRRLDLLSLGDDSAAVLGVAVRRTRLYAVLLAVALSAAAVGIAGPIGFVGLCAPVIVRLLARVVPGLGRHRALLPAAALSGALIIVGADLAVRALLGARAGVDLPAGVVTTVLGAGVLVWLARGQRDSGPTRQPPAGNPAVLRGRGYVRLVLAAAGVAVAGAGVAGLLLGDTLVLLGDVANWLGGRTGRALTFVLDQRYPRVLAALTAGAALGIAGTAVQAVCRNPLAEPGLLGITGGAGVAAVALITYAPLAGGWTMAGVAGAGALAAFALVYGLARRRDGLRADRLVLIGVAIYHGTFAAITMIIVLSDPWNTAKALTWLSGSTYGRTLAQVIPVAAALLLLTPVIALRRRTLDLLSLDDDTPRVLGVRLERSRLVILLAAALLAAAAVAAVGVIGFVGLVAPHAARALVGGAHGRVLPVAALLGALLVSLADTLGRTAIAPAQVPAGLVTALVGTPYFVWLLWRARRSG
ncbi:iron-hydroxamate transporter permease subunit [Pilimelia anulata]|uniref:Iron-hydroxamate transporter permease subunit n=1 Tax=Pilimelia anulata TaxID=53371 RepID=A0A8J3BEA8_9ACTN|nr:iron-hydroxamate transporter permease subunit [Pilimelia anulata]